MTATATQTVIRNGDRVEGWLIGESTWPTAGCTLETIATACPKRGCKGSAGHRCTTKSGKPAQWAHSVRMEAAGRAFRGSVVKAVRI